MKILETNRLILRTWRESDAQKYWEINSDSKVIEFLLGPMQMSEVIGFIQKQNNQFIEKNHCLFAVELKHTSELIGSIGLNYTDFLNKIEVSWRLGSQYWGNGYATEGAIACLDYGFDILNLYEITSFTVPKNLRSINVMKRIGLKRDEKSNVTHPKLPKNHKFSHHIIFRLNKDEYFAKINAKEKQIMKIIN